MGSSGFTSFYKKETGTLTRFLFFFHKRFFFVEGQTFKTRKKGGILHGYQFYLE